MQACRAPRLTDESSWAHFSRVARCPLAFCAAASSRLQRVTLPRRHLALPLSGTAGHLGCRVCEDGAQLRVVVVQVVKPRRQAVEVFGREDTRVVRLQQLEQILGDALLGLQHHPVQTENDIDHLLLVVRVGVVALEDHDGIVLPLRILAKRLVLASLHVVEVHLVHSPHAHVAPLLEAAPSTALVCRLVADEARVLVLSRRGDDDEVLRKRREHTKRVDGVDAGRDVLLRDRGVVQEDVQALLGVAVLLAERLERADHVVELEQVGVRVAPREPLVADERNRVLLDEDNEVLVVVHVHQHAFPTCIFVRRDLAQRLEAAEVDDVERGLDGPGGVDGPAAACNLLLLDHLLGDDGRPDELGRTPAAKHPNDAENRDKSDDDGDENARAVAWWAREN
mmetsp:Transcript_40733/g.118854  ORF Transcript_40733/g.118854 Transcript_40733/m.118854 type:complete len:396 (-) Transcript_40733:1176-2363(-)